MFRDQTDRPVLRGQFAEDGHRGGGAESQQFGGPSLSLQRLLLDEDCFWTSQHELEVAQGTKKCRPRGRSDRLAVWALCVRGQPQWQGSGRGGRGSAALLREKSKLQRYSSPLSQCFVTVFAESSEGLLGQ